MRGLAVLTVAFVFASTALFVSPASAQGTATLDGLVCVQSSGYGYPQPADSSQSPCSYSQGLPDATVKLTRAGTLPSPAPAPAGPTQISATTDANGAYSFSSVTAGDYSFVVSRIGFKDATGTITVASGSHKDHVLVGNPVDAKGKITDPDGAAVAKAIVNLCCGANGSATATSGTDGRYSVSVQAGFWSIDVQAPGFQSTYQSLLVDGGEINFKLERIPPQDGKLTGVVRDQDGQPVPDARVALSNYGYGCCYAYASDGAPDSESSSRPYYSGENYTTSDAQGRFSMNAYSGDNSLSVSKEGYAYHSRNVVIAKGEATSIDVELMKYPEKTAQIVGKVVDAKTGKGLANVYLSLQSPEYGLYECSESASASGSGTSASSGSTEPKSASMSIAYPEPYPNPGCAIKTNADGTFQGMVTPGYAILSVYVDHYASCTESSDADGSYSRVCGPEYYSWANSRTLAADDTTTFDIRLRSRPAPDAEVSGYIVDAETGDAIPNAQISFNNQDTYGWGSASTDGDGSYRLRLRSGYHSVSVYAEGHLRWEGVIDIAKGDTPFDVKVEPGTESYGGGCCYGPYYGGGVAYASAEDSSVKSYSVTASSAPRAMGAPSEGMSSDGTNSQGEQYEDLGGGLGPYDASQREAELDGASKGSPGLGLVAFLAALGAVFMMRRRAA